MGKDRVNVRTRVVKRRGQFIIIVPKIPNSEAFDWILDSSTPIEQAINLVRHYSKHLNEAFNG